MSEKILVIPTKLAEILCPKPFWLAAVDSAKLILDHQSFRDREEAETNFEFKQVIPYVLVRYIDCFLVSQRVNQQEKRLNNKHSIGQGGHINDKDFNSGGSILGGMFRELKEEFSLSDTIMSCKQVGLINDNSNEVGRVHLGLVYSVEVNSAEFMVGEQGKHVAQWVRRKNVLRYYDSMESWSQLVVQELLVKQPLGN